MRDVQDKRERRQNADDHEKSLSESDVKILHERVLGWSLACLNSTNGVGHRPKVVAAQTSIRVWGGFNDLLGTLLTSRGCRKQHNMRPTMTIKLRYRHQLHLERACVNETEDGSSRVIVQIR